MVNRAKEHCYIGATNHNKWLYCLGCLGYLQLMRKYRIVHVSRKYRQHISYSKKKVLAAWTARAGVRI